LRGPLHSHSQTPFGALTLPRVSTRPPAIPSNSVPIVAPSLRRLSETRPHSHWATHFVAWIPFSDFIIHPEPTDVLSKTSGLMSSISSVPMHTPPKDSFRPHVPLRIVANCHITDGPPLDFRYWLYGTSETSPTQPYPLFTSPVAYQHEYVSADAARMPTHHSTGAHPARTVIFQYTSRPTSAHHYSDIGEAAVTAIPARNILLRPPALFPCFHTLPCGAGHLPPSPSPTFTHPPSFHVLCATHNSHYVWQHLSRTRGGSFLSGGHHHNSKPAATPRRTITVLYPCRPAALPHFVPVPFQLWPCVL
jgi:hypothetical protein